MKFRTTDGSCNTFELEGSLLNTNTIDAFKTNDKKAILESLSDKVCYHIGV